MPLLTRPTARRAPSAFFSRLIENVRPQHIALGRTGIGVVMLVQPTAMPRLLGVDSAASSRTAWVGQMLGAREVALGAGTLWALRAPGRGAVGWVLAGVLCDSVDALTVGAAAARGRVSRPLGGAVVTSAVAAAVLGGRSATTLR